MSQNSVVLALVGVFSGLTEQGSINGALDTLRTNFSGASAPSTPSAWQWWYDTTNKQLKMYDGTSWAIVASYDAATHLWLPYSGGAQIGASGGNSILVYGGNYEVKRPRRNTTTTTEALADSDRGQHVTFSNAGAVAVSSVVPDGTHFTAGWQTYIENINTGVMTWTPTGATVNGGSALKLRKGEFAFIDSDGANFRAFHTGQIVYAAGVAPDNRELGTRDQIPNIQNANYTFTFDDRGNSVQHDSATAGHVWTIPAESSVNFPVGTTIGLEALTGSATVSIQITTDTLRRGDGTSGGGAGGAGTRVLGADSFAFVKKVKAATWYMGGKFT